MPVESIILAIQSLPLKEVLIYLGAQGITHFSSAGYEKIKKVVIDKQNEGKYAFVPHKDEVLFLQEAERNPDYQQLLLLVPNYKYIDLIKTGLLIKKYDGRIVAGEDVSKNRDSISRIKGEIVRRPGGRRLLKIVKLPTTHFFSIILSYLHELKIHGHPEEQLVEEFDEIVDEWEKSSKFVNAGDSASGIISFCKRNLEDENPRFFLSALYDNQINIVEDALTELKEETFFKERDYEVKIEKDGAVDLPRIEVTFKKRINS